MSMTRNGSFIKDIPMKTIVVMVPTQDVETLSRLINAYASDLPPKLATLLNKMNELLTQ